MKAGVYNMDCMEAMKAFPDGFFDLAVVDPPYGLGKRTTDGGGTNSQIKFMDDIRRTNWDDNAPSIEYFEQLFRVSKNQIIWGGNYFDLPPTRTIVCWEKMVAIPTMSQIEIAWTSFDSPARIVKINNTDKNRFHPTQKPVKLYEWIYMNYLPNGGKVIDTHLGSGSNRIAADKQGNIEFYGFEIDKEYFDASVKRFDQYKAQLTMF
jgi:site-specific DNA-methyltransferase (adenine-specific)